MIPDSPILETLHRHQVPFVVIGGLALIEHGYVRTTEDTDIVFWRGPEAETALLAALRELDAHWLANETDPATGMPCANPVTPAYVRTCRLMMLVTTAGFLDIFDFLPSLSDEPVANLFRDSVERDGVRFASREWLIRLKRASGRPRDLDDLSHLENTP
ncbi:MAG: hypothetical protein WCH61_07845 [bacterium]